MNGSGLHHSPGLFHRRAHNRNSVRASLGVALILVLWFVVLLGVLALGLSKVSRNGALTARQLTGATQARYLAEGGVQKVVANLLMAPDGERLLGDGEEFTLSFKQGRVDVVLWNEGGKVDINSASEALLVRLFEALGLSSEQSEILAAAIADWRDEDDLVRLHGAEDEDYLAAGLTYGAGDSAFTSVGELRKVLGMDEGIYQQVEAYVTVYSKSPGVNPNVAPLPVLLAVSDVEVNALEHYIAERRRTHRSGLPLPPAPVIDKGFLSNKEGRVFTLSAWAVTEQNNHAGRSVVFQLIESEGRKRVKILHSQPYALRPQSVESYNMDAVNR